VSLRTCWDSADPEPVPWLAAPLLAACSRIDGSSICTPVEAISERGADLQLAATERAALSSALLVQLRGPENQTVATLRAQIVLEQTCRSGHVRISVLWSAGQQPQLEQLQQWLFCRPGCWQQRQATGEWQALLALIKRQLRRPRPLAAGQRSLVHQANPARPPAADNGGR